ncbi:MAG: class I SAM-dependent methyltransferase [Planctomycetia bacterium]|jgi:SAM-dependent methyltransferase|nr:class I SAM-dependent methyltransferase [Planctomycetia bacterium]
MNFWNERYRHPGASYGTEPNDFLCSHVSTLPQGRILSLCEGEGRNAVFLARHGYEVLAVDGSTVGLQNAEDLARRRGVKIKTEVADLADYNIAPDYWDGMILIFAHLPGHIRIRIHQQAVLGLRAGGVLLLEAFGPGQTAYNTGGPKNPDLLPSLEQLQSEFQGLEYIVAQTIQREIHEGTHHTGPAEVVQIIGRRKS